jgi:hypothetical protein
MKNIDLGQTIGILANLGVLAGIVFLGFELRQSTRTTQATASQSVTEAESQAILQWVIYPDIVLSFSKPELTAEETIRLHSWLAFYARAHENYWSQFRLGVIDEETFQRYERAIAITLSFERNRNWWANMRGNFDPSFTARIDALLATFELIPAASSEVLSSLFDPPTHN